MNKLKLYIIQYTFPLLLTLFYMFYMIIAGLWLFAIVLLLGPILSLIDFFEKE